MRLHVIARGKIGRSPEAELVARYEKRIAWPCKLTELPETGGGKNFWVLRFYSTRLVPKNPGRNDQGRDEHESVDGRSTPRICALDLRAQIISN